MQDNDPVSPDHFESPRLMSPSQPLISADTPPTADKQVAPSATSQPQPPPYTKPPQPSDSHDKDYTALFVNILQADGDADQVTRNTLDEPIMDTVKRDLSGISAKLQTVLSAGQADTDAEMTLREWDMWGPLLFSLLLAVSLSQRVEKGASFVFELCFLLIWGGAVVVYANARLLGHKASLMHAICYLGYSVAPLAVVAAIGFVLPFAVINTVLVVCALVWSISASAKFFIDPRLEEKRLLISFPLVLYFFTIAWLCIIS